MKKNFKKVLVSLMAVGAIFCSGHAFAHEINIYCNNGDVSTSGKDKKEEKNTAYINNERELQTAINKEKSTIILNSDITITGNLNIPKGCLTIDLDGHTIKFGSASASIVIGDKRAISVPYTVTHPGYSKTVVTYKDKYTTDAYGNQIYVGQEAVNETVWVPPCTETKYNTYYEYKTDVKVTIKNGSIIGMDGYNGKSITKERFFKSDVSGYDGETPAELINGISGDIHLSNLSITTGNGGNGGNGYYSEECHIPLFGSGNGGNGGHGGNGGSAIFTEQANVSVSGVSFSLGKGGKGGKGSEPNPNYWIYSGSKGKNGKKGKSGVIINDASKYRPF